MKNAKTKRLKGIFRIYSLRIKLLTHMILIMLMMGLMGTYCIYTVGNGRVTDELNLRLGGRIAEPVPESHGVRIDAAIVQDILGQAQRRMTLVLAVCVGGAIAILVLFIRNIIEPLNAIVAATRQMSEGNLGGTIPVQSDDEIGELGNMINDLSVNFQEILLDVWNGTTHSNRLLAEIDKSIRSRSCSCISPRLQKEIEFLRRHSEDMQAIIRTFDLYEVHLEEEKVKAGPQPEIEWD